ncbi:aldolase [Patellaria atrata CBS 101060]|uniref:Aldolase n=1 Tax=Patellaria atrata CBS 101060 TaxID=1346257 RepID=A0A9P4VRY5_9PEZI|nr:aldolase [Patellaria atrata CBS 101060]
MALIQSETSIPPPKGIYVPVPTFFNPTNTQLDLDTQTAHTLHLARCGIRGLVLLGSTGEAVHLSRAERCTLITHIRAALTDAGFTDYPLIAGTASQGVDETVELLKEAKEAGAGWGLCLAPGFYAAGGGGGGGEAGVQRWFETVASCSAVPILVYHYPGVSNNVTISASTMEKLAEHPNIVGCKLSHGNLDDHSLIALSPKINHTNFKTFTGLGQQLLSVLTVGGAGAVDGLAAIFPKTVVKLYDLFHENPLKNLEQMRVLQYKIAAAEKLVVKFGTVGIKDAVARVRGFGKGDYGRLPLGSAILHTDAEWTKNWKEVFDALEEVEKSLPGVIMGLIEEP